MKFLFDPVPHKYALGREQSSLNLKLCVVTEHDPRPLSLPLFFPISGAPIKKDWEAGRLGGGDGRDGGEAEVGMMPPELGSGGGGPTMLG